MAGFEWVNNGLGQIWVKPINHPYITGQKWVGCIWVGLTRELTQIKSLRGKKCPTLRGKHSQTRTHTHTYICIFSICGLLTKTLKIKSASQFP